MGLTSADSVREDEMSQVAAEYDEFPADAEWLQQDGETAKAYAAFCSYRGRGALRSLRQACQEHYGMAEIPPPCRSNVPAKLRQIQTWSSDYQWVQRAKAYDAHLDRMVRIDNLEREKKMRRRHAAIAALGVEKAGQRIAAINPPDLSIGEALALLRASIPIERSAREETIAPNKADSSPVSLPVSTADRLMRDRIIPYPKIAVAAAEVSLALSEAKFGRPPVPAAGDSGPTLTWSLFPAPAPADPSCP